MWILSPDSFIHPGVTLQLRTPPATLSSLLLPSRTSDLCLSKQLKVQWRIRSRMFRRWYVVRLGLMMTRPSLYVDRAGFGQTASSTLVISYGGSIDRPWPEVEGEGWRSGRPKNLPGEATGPQYQGFTESHQAECNRLTGPFTPDYFCSK